MLTTIKLWLTSILLWFSTSTVLWLLLFILTGSLIYSFIIWPYLSNMKYIATTLKAIWNIATELRIKLIKDISQHYRDILQTVLNPKGIVLIPNLIISICQLIVMTFFYLPFFILSSLLIITGAFVKLSMYILSPKSTKIKTPNKSQDTKLDNINFKDTHLVLSYLTILKLSVFLNTISINPSDIDYTNYVSIRKTTLTNSDKWFDKHFASIINNIIEKYTEHKNFKICIVFSTISPVVTDINLQQFIDMANIAAQLFPTTHFSEQPLVFVKLYTTHNIIYSYSCSLQKAKDFTHLDWILLINKTITNLHNISKHEDIKRHINSNIELDKTFEEQATKHNLKFMYLCIFPIFL